MSLVERPRVALRVFRQSIFAIWFGKVLLLSKTSARRPVEQKILTHIGKKRQVVSHQTI